MLNDAFGYDERFPENIQLIFLWLCQDLADLNQTWDFYLGIFENKADRELLSKYLPSSFRVIEQSLRISMIMSICRLSDPYIQKKNENLSLDTLRENFQMIEGLENLFNEFNIACKPFEVFRNKRIGHRDLLTTLDYENFLLPGISKNQVDNVVTIANNILNKIALHFTESEFYFKSIDTGGANYLIELIRQGIQSKERWLSK